MNEDLKVNKSVCISLQLLNSFCEWMESEGKTNFSEEVAIAMQEKISKSKEVK
jgi:hypothetical protein